MPAAKLTLDFDNRKFYDSSGVVIIAMSGKKDSIREYELIIQQDGQPMSLPDTTTITVAMKKTADPAGTLLTSTVAARSGWGTGSRWVFTLDMTGDPFTPVLGTKVDFDIMIVLPDGQQFMSLTVPFTIEKPVQVP
jgi:hypothetical protein